jgi:FMN phosphatase YigB (HAD superfamily)
MFDQYTEIYLLFDDGNVLNNNKIRGEQWQKLIGEFMTPNFGGNPKDWGTANAKIVENFINKGIPTLMYEHKEKNHKQYIEWFIEYWINNMFDYAGIERPDESKYNEIYYNAAKYVNLRVNSAFPDVKETIKILCQKGYNLCTASGTESIELKYYLEGMEIKPYFNKFYGPDLVNTLKVDDKFYTAIFTDLRIKPEQAIVIDDKPYYLKIAEKLGAHTIQACLIDEVEPKFDNYIISIKSLPKIIEKIIHESN